MSLNNCSYDANGLKLTEMEEGFRETSYRDIAGVWTIGYGHASASVVEGMTITAAQGEALLDADIATAVTFVNRAVTVPISQGEFDALVDFTFNEGMGTLSRSSLLRDLNAGNREALTHDFQVYDMAGGKLCPPLLKRRELEVAELGE